jgi:hypothetical protein
MEGRPLRDEPRFGGDYQKYRQAYKAWHERERTRRSKLLTLPALAPERPTVSASADGAMPWRTHENEKVTATDHGHSVNDDAETVGARVCGRARKARCAAACWCHTHKKSHSESLAPTMLQT